MDAPKKSNKVKVTIEFEDVEGPVKKVYTCPLRYLYISEHPNYQDHGMGVLEYLGGGSKIEIKMDCAEKEKA